MNEENAGEVNERATRRVRIRYAIYFLLILAVVIGILDYQRYHAQLDRAMAVVSDLEGRAGSLLDWPFGRDMVISFERPLSGEELERLAVLNSLQGRHNVSVFFRCQLTPQQLTAAKAALPDLSVRQVDD